MPMMQQILPIATCILALGCAGSAPAPAVQPSCTEGTVLRIDNRTQSDVDILERVHSVERVVTTVSPGSHTVPVTPTSGGHYLARRARTNDYLAHERSVSGPVRISRSCADG